MKRIKACRGRWSGTSCPAPVTVTKVSPLYTWLHPPTYNRGKKKLGDEQITMEFCKILIPPFSYCITRKEYQIPKPSVQWLHQNQVVVAISLTFPLSYHGYQFIIVGSFRASIEYRVAVTGTTESVSPLVKEIKQGQMHCIIRLKTQKSYNADQCRNIKRWPDLH